MTTVLEIRHTGRESAQFADVKPPWKDVVCKPVAGSSRFAGGIVWMDGRRY